MAILKYDLFYRNFGIWKNIHILNPRIFDFSEIKLPILSEYHNFSIPPNIENINKDSDLYQNMDKAICRTVLEYDEASVSGKFRKLPVIPNGIIGKFAKEEKRIRFIKYNMNFKPLDRMVEIQHYGALNSRYLYLPQPFRSISIYSNAFNTALSLCENSKRNVFLKIEMPLFLMSRQDLTRFAKKLTNAQSKIFSDYRLCHILELWKYINSKLRETSIFSRISNENTKKINLVFVKGNRCAILNLYKLNSIIEENITEKGFEKDQNMRPIKSDIFSKLFYIFLYRFNEGKKIEPDDYDILTIRANKKDKFSKIRMPSGPSEGGDTIVASDLDKILTKKIKEENLDLNSLIADKEEEEEEEGSILNNNLMNGNFIYLEKEKIVEEEYRPIEEIDLGNYEFNRVAKISKQLLDNKTIGPALYKKVNNILESQKNKRVDYALGEELGEILSIKKYDIGLDKNSLEINDSASVLDKTQNKNISNSLNKSYIEKEYKKDVIRTIYSLQNNRSVIEDYNVSYSNNLQNELETHEIKILTPGIGSSTIKVVLPKISENGRFKFNGNTYIKRFSRIDTPIHKIKFNTVCLTTYYSKIFINKCYYSKNNFGAWLSNILYKLYSSGKIKNLISTPQNNMDLDLPQDYQYFSRFIKSFKINEVSYHFHYPTRGTIFKKISDDDIKKIEGSKYTIIGNDKGYPILIDKYNNFFKYNNKREYEPYPNLYSTLEINTSDGPLEMASVTHLSKEIPVLIFFLYYLGISEFLKYFNFKFKVENPKATNSKNNDQIVVRFSNIKLLIDKTNDYRDLILGGFLSKDIVDILKTINHRSLDDRNKFSVFFNKYSMTLIEITEMKLLENLYVDPVTAKVLMELKEPTTFFGLLIRSCELLYTDNYKNPNSMSEMLIRGYSDIPGILYKEFISGVKLAENKHYFTKAKISINPYSVINKLMEDSSVVLEDTINPIASIKQTEDLVSNGVLGKKKETMSIDTRKVYPEDIGIISEATRDSGDVGISSYLSASPNIGDIIGRPTQEELNYSNIYSSSALLSPFSTTDDTKRLNFNSIMQSHIIPIVNMRAPYVLTGYEGIVSVKSSNLYVESAKESGKVLLANDKEVVIEYKTLGVKTYKLKEWATNELSETTYIHKQVSSLKKGDRVEKDDTIYYDDLFFEPSLFDKKRAIYKQGNVVKVALTEELMTDEDSAVISNNLKEFFTSNITKVKTFILAGADNIINLVKVGDKVTPSTTLFTSIDKSINLEGKDPRSLEILKNLTQISPTAKINGIIKKIEIKYNGNKNDYSYSVRKIIDEENKKSISEHGYDRSVDSSYSSLGRSLPELSYELKIYIETKNPMSLGDKGILSNQLKFTIGNISNSDLITYQTNEAIDMLFSFRSISARIVNSPLLNGTTSAIMEKIEKDIIDIYFS